MRQDRVDALCAWLLTEMPSSPIYRHPGFAQFADLTDGEIYAAEIEIRRRGDALEASLSKRSGKRDND